MFTIELRAKYVSSMILAMILIGLLIVFPSKAEDIKADKVNHASFVGPITGKPIAYNIYLPPDYNKSDKRYPVIYHLHGLECDEFQGNEAIVGALRKAMKAGIIEPVIVVFPKGYSNTFWADSKDGKRPGETHIIRELIPHVDSKYRTIADREQRVIEGMSMGGYGAVEYAVKFPEIFCVCIGYDGAILDWDMFSTYKGEEDELEKTAPEVFGNDEEYFNKFSPWHNAKVNADKIRGRVAFRSIVGVIRGPNEKFNELMKSLGMRVDYAETKCKHDIDCMAETQWRETFTFISENLGKQQKTPKGK